jgi:hypothetical protein
VNHFLYFNTLYYAMAMMWEFIFVSVFLYYTDSLFRFIIIENVSGSILLQIMRQTLTGIVVICDHRKPTF